MMPCPPLQPPKLAVARAEGSSPAAVETGAGPDTSLPVGAGLAAACHLRRPPGHGWHRGCHPGLLRVITVLGGWSHTPSEQHPSSSFLGNPPQQWGCTLVSSSAGHLWTTEATVCWDRRGGKQGWDGGLACPAYPIRGGGDRSIGNLPYCANGTGCSRP